MRARAFYNEIDPFAAAWLRELIEHGFIAPGDVDERPIQDLTPDDLHGYTQCHFFAGIGVWSYALRCAGWPDDRAVWTGSCPCPPFSIASAVWRTRGFDNDDHLWPYWFPLIAVGNPAIVFGEQVASKDGLAWLDAVYDDLEDAGYAVAAANLSAAGVGAPHVRQRIYFVADAHTGSVRCEGRGLVEESERARTALEARRAIAGVLDSALTDRGWNTDEPMPTSVDAGATAAVGRLRGYGNALCAPVAQAFIEAYVEARA